MKWQTACSVVWIWLALCAAGLSAAEPAAPPDVTRAPKVIAFFGDSITHAGTYHQQIQLFLATRYPGRDLWTINVGQSGQTAKGAADNMLDSELLARQPDIVFIHFGMNDIGREGFLNKLQPPSDEERAERRDRYRTKMAQIVEALHDRKIEWVVLSPTIYDDTVQRWNNAGKCPHLDAELVLFGQYGRELAASQGGSFIDLHTPMGEINRAEQAKDPQFSLTGDRVHPRREGEAVMVHSILKGLKVRPAVYDVEVSVAGQVTRQEGATVSDVKAGERMLSFALTETALPFPAPGQEYRLVRFQDEMNRMELAIADLPAGNWQLSIDGEEIGTYSAAQLQEGVNLSTEPKTPQYRESLKLQEMILERKLKAERAVRDMYSLSNHIRWNELDGEIDWANPDPAKVLAAVDALEEKFEQEGKPPKGWLSYVMRAGRAGYERYAEIQAELADIRRELANRPASWTHRYELKRLP